MLLLMLESNRGKITQAKIKPTPTPHATPITIAPLKAKAPKAGAVTVHQFCGLS